MKKITSFFVSVYVLIPSLVSAQQLQNPLKADSFEGLFQNILSSVIIPVSSVIGVFFIIWAGFGFVTAQGNDAKLSAAKKRLMYVLIGVGIVIASEVILDLLLNTLKEVSNVSVINTNLG